MYTAENMKRKRIAISAPAARTGGGMSRVRELIATFPLLAGEHDYLFVLNRRVEDSIPPSSGPADSRISVPTLLSAAPLRLVWEHAWLPHILTRENVEWVFSPFNTLPLGLARRRIRSAVIVSNIAPFIPEMWRGLNSYQLMRLRLLRLLTFQTLRIADVVFVLSHEAVNRLGRDLPHEKVVHLPMAPPNPMAIRESEKVSLAASIRGHPYFLVVGDLMAHKGIEDAIRAIGRLAEQGHDYRLLICGSPVEPKYSRRLYVLSRAVAPRHTSFLGSVSYLETLALISRSLATVVCARFENTSRVPVESMAMGTPVISANVPISRETCGEAALYYPPGNVAQLAEAMTSVAERPEVRDALLRAGSSRMRGVDWLAASRRILQAMELL